MLRSFVIFVLREVIPGDGSEEDEMGGTLSTHGRNGK
jgi:hypothetical protein